MRIAVYGVGGVGGYFGARLAQAREEVIFIARGEHLRAIREQGLRVESIKGDVVIDPAQATDDPSSVGSVDVILVAVKAWQVPDAATRMRPMVGPATAVVPLGNGVEAPEQLAAVLGGAHVLGGLCTILSMIAGPGHIRHMDIEPTIAFGELNGQPSARAERLRRAFVQAGVAADIPPDIQAAMWNKFLFIAAFSGVGAITRAPAGILRRVPETRQMLEAAMREVLAVAQARGVGLTEAAIDRTMVFINKLAEGATASMQRDILDGRPSELAFQSGAVMRIGQEVGVATPLHTTIYHSLLPQEMRARGEVSF